MNADKKFQRIRICVHSRRYAALACSRHRSAVEEEL
jgi:hypothetical protein